ncbi:MAG: DsbA family protein [Candidatus Woesearchaeota archaeon]
MTEEKKHEEHKDHEHNSKHVYMEHHAHKKHKAYEISTWILAGISFLLLVGLILALTLGGKSSINSTPMSDVETSVESYLKSISDDQATVDSISDENGLYRVQLTVAGRQYDSYVTKDGKLLFPQGIDLTAPVAPVDTTTQQPSNVPKSDKPVVELFVMSHCPYGTQAEKGILPAIRTLDDTIDFKIRFVYYAMHGELEVKEQLTQHCIQTEQSDKYLKYLACFLNSSDGGSASWSNTCLTQVGVDKTALESCKTDADTEFNVMKNFNDQASWLNGRFPKFDTDLALNTKYGIGGSPTLVINGVQSNAGRDSVSYLNAICAAFNNAPEECTAVLSSTQPGPGFGYDSVGAANAAGCGV